MRKLISLLIIIICPLLAAYGQQAPKYEIRASWITTLGGLDWPTRKATSKSGIEAQKKELCDILDRLKAANFNTVLLQTRVRGDVIYPSAIETFTESLAGKEGRSPGYDPLQFAIDECHKRGMELHAWMVAIPIGNNRQVKLLEKNSVVKKQPSICIHYKDNWYLDPGNPKTDSYLAKLVNEVVSRYDVDGIHFDYIRYPERAKDFPDNASYRKYGKKKDLSQWRRENMTRIVRRLYTEVKQLKPWVKVSSSPIGKYNDTGRYSSSGWNAYKEVYQDAQLWLKSGMHDALFPMMYFQGNNFYPFALDWQENKSGRWIVPGLGIYFLHPKEQDWKLDEIARQIYFLRNIKADGEAYFRNRFVMDNTKGLLDELQEHFYATPAVVPPMTWADSIAPTVPTDTRLNILDKGVKISWKASTDNTPKGGVYYRIYASNTYPVDTNMAENIIETRIDGTEYTFCPTSPWQEKMYWAITAVDRCGNESEAVQLVSPF